MTLLRSWLERHKPDNETSIAIDRWHKASIEPENAIALLETYERWLEDRSAPEPDLVACLAAYGHARLLLQGWRLPIDVPESEYDAWRAEHHHMTLADFQERLAEVVGGFMEMAGRDTASMLRILQSGLTHKMSELQRLASQPVDEYTPKFTEQALTARYKAVGLTGKDLSLAVAEHMLDGDDGDEQRRFDKVFALRQELECFEWGMEKFRMLALTEHVPEIALPNRAIYDALAQIDLNGLLADLEKVDVRLRGIWRHLATHRYYRLNASFEPERFWWRHYKQQRHKPGK